MNSVENTDAEEEEDSLVPDIGTDDFVACLLLCAVLDPTSPKIRRRREFWRQVLQISLKSYRDITNKKLELIFFELLRIKNY